MTTEKHDPWALLREARESIAQDFDSGPAGRRTLLDLLKRIDAALAEHQAEDKVAVEWARFGPMGQRTRIGDAEVTVRNLGVRMSEIDSGYSWHIEVWGRATTLDEAKSAAIAAARGNL